MITLLPGETPLDPIAQETEDYCDRDSDLCDLDSVHDPDQCRGSRARGVLGATDLWLAQHLGDRARWRISSVFLGIAAGAPAGLMIAKYL